MRAVQCLSVVAMAGVWLTCASVTHAAAPPQFGAGVVTRITYLGNRNLSNRDLDDVIGIRVGTPVDPIAKKAACQNIVRCYRDDGRHFASCELIMGSVPDDTEVIFNIVEGPLARVNSVGFSGNEFVSSAVLMNRTKAFRNGATSTAVVVDAVTHELLGYYRSHGFHDVKVTHEMAFSEGGRDAHLIFHIVEGVRYRLTDKPRIVGCSSLPGKVLDELGKTKEGNVYNQADIDHDTAAIRDAIGYTGRNARVIPNIHFPRETPGKVRVIYEVIEQAPAHVGQIIINGNEPTRDTVILQHIPLFPGQVLQYPEIRRGERNLSRLGIFETNRDGTGPSISVLDNPQNPDSEFKDILVTVQDASTGSLMFGLGVNSDSGLNGSVILNERNFDVTRLPTSLHDLLSGNAFRGRGQKYRIELRLPLLSGRVSCAASFADALFKASVGSGLIGINYDADRGFSMSLPGWVN